jgi:hypothetical protein
LLPGFLESARTFCGDAVPPQGQRSGRLDGLAPAARGLVLLLLLALVLPGGLSPEWMAQRLH